MFIPEEKIFAQRLKETSKVEDSTATNNENSLFWKILIINYKNFSVNVSQVISSKMYSFLRPNHDVMDQIFFTHFSSYGKRDHI